MSNNPLRKLEQTGQSIWLDFLSRKLVTSGQLQSLVDQDGLKGLTSNPSIFEKALSAGDDYDTALQGWADSGMSAEEMYAQLTVEDIQMAADVLRPTWERLEHADGYVSLEVNPHLAYDTAGTIEEAGRLWELVDRPNLFIKVPATEPGLQAIRQLTSDGLNINVTLLFGLQRYVQVAEAYISGLEDRLARGEPISDVHSVASFFLSRIDVLVDPKLEELAQAGGEHAATAERLHGQAAIASAREAYRICADMLAGERWQRLAQQGATAQRLLWASTHTQNPKYSDVKYVEALIAPNTVNTLPLETLEAYRDHGDPAIRIHDELDLTQEVLTQLPVLGIFLGQVTQQLEEEGVEKFNKAYDELLQAVEKKRQQALGRQPEAARRG